MTLVSSNLNWTKSSWKSVVEADAKGYYAYLPATFIYKDPNFGFFDSIEKGKYFDKNMYYDYRSVANGKVISKYYVGTAVAQLPFFLTAHSLCIATGGDADGYSKIYMVLVCVAALFYLFIGMIYLNKTLILYDITEKQRSFILITMVFGTNLFYYSVSEPALSHIFSFAFISMFIYFVKLYFSKHKPKHILFVAFILGMIVLIRPVNGLIIFLIPFLAGSFESLKIGFKYILNSLGTLLIGSSIFILIVSIQLIIYKYSTGNYFIYAYGEEGFNFLSPHIIDILFSYRKGLFLYTPIYLISFAGIYFLFPNKKYEALTWLTFFFLITYVFSSWWMWYYGGSFSSRVYVEFLPFFMIMLSFLLKNLQSKISKIVTYSLLSILLVICQIQTFQYRYYDIHWSEMTKEKYWKVFLRVDRLINKETTVPEL